MKKACIVNELHEAFVVGALQSATPDLLQSAATYSTFRAHSPQSAHSVAVVAWAVCAAPRALRHRAACCAVVACAVCAAPRALRHRAACCVREICGDVQVGNGWLSEQLSAWQSSTCLDAVGVP
eukprot:1158893-Pelagomonas_calceolata.AAC.22